VDNESKSSASDNTEAEASNDNPAAGSEGKTSSSSDGAAVALTDSERVPQTPYKILDDALLSLPRTKPDGGRAYLQPVLFDCILAGGLLVAMGGFTIGLFKIYITHSAEQSITQRNYKAAIAILRGAPFPGLFTVRGKDPQELLNQALYLEAMEKLDANDDDQTAINELTQIQPGSKFFELAQQIVKEHTTTSSVQLQGQAQHEASPNDRVVEDKMEGLPVDPKDSNH
jgi:hypothetical protein